MIGRMLAVVGGYGVRIRDEDEDEDEDQRDAQCSSCSSE
jgi:hypothetical protein